MAHGDHQNFVPKEALTQIEPAEVQGLMETQIKEKFENNVIPFKDKEDTGDKEPKMGTHAMSMKVLKDLGHNNYLEATGALIDLNRQKEQALLSFTNKIKDRIFNGGQESKKVTELEEKIARLKKAVTLAETTASKEGIELYDQPVEVPSEEQEFKKAA